MKNHTIFPAYKLIYPSMQTRKIVGRFIKPSSSRVDIDCKRPANKDYNNNDDDDNMMTFHTILETKTAPNRMSARCWTAKSILLQEVSFREGHSTNLLSVRGVPNCLNQRVLGDHCHNARVTSANAILF